MRELVLDNDRRREAGDALGLSFLRVKALIHVDREPLVMGELAGSLQIEAPYATVVVDELERLGLVERRPHPTDRRAKVVVATARGAAAARRAVAVLETPPAPLCELDESDLETLVHLLDRVRSASSTDLV